RPPRRSTGQDPTLTRRLLAQAEERNPGRGSEGESEDPVRDPPTTSCAAEMDGLDTLRDASATLPAISTACAKLYETLGGDDVRESDDDARRLAGERGLGTCLIAQLTRCALAESGRDHAAELDAATWLVR